MKTVRILLLSLAALPVAALAQTDRVFGDGIDQHCLDGANQNAALWKQQGLADAKIQNLFQQYLATCSGADPASAMVYAAANVDFYRFARMVAAGTISPDLYVGLVRDRERKMRAALKSRAWLDAWTHGDSDGDMIPDSMDRCPGTPDLTRTDNSGCPDRTPLAPQPSREQLLPVLNTMHVFTAPACDAASFPEMAPPLGFAFELIQAPPPFTVTVVPVPGQPATCRLLYEVQAQFSMPGQNSPVGPTDLVTVVFRSNEMTVNHGFMVYATDKGAKYHLWYDAANYNHMQVRVRAINGNGLTSGWSDWKKNW